MPNNTELLSPAGDKLCLKAAIANGADAVYFGLSDFNARKRAENFSVEDLPQTFDYLHSRGRKGYVTLNTLVFPSEMAQVMKMVDAIAEAGADAVIVQDLGLASEIHRVYPDLPLHASTQMTLTNTDALSIAESMGMKRVVLPRELSLQEIEAIIGKSSLELEVFIHGALCVSYSGQCLASLSMGGRSSNRGECAQACRLPYEVIRDGVEKILDDDYPLSPKDLAGFESVPELVRLGVSALKIEGRLKDANYVAATTRAYRCVLDAALEGKSLKLSKENMEMLDQTFSRGFCSGYLNGRDYADMMEGGYRKKNGVHFGTVLGVFDNGVSVLCDDSKAYCLPVAGMGMAFASSVGNNELDAGGRVIGVEAIKRLSQIEKFAKRAIKLLPPGQEPHEKDSNQRLFHLKFRREDLDCMSLELGSEVWKTDDPSLKDVIKATYAKDAPVLKRKLHVKVDARIGQPLHLEFSCKELGKVKVFSAKPMDEARKHALSEDLLQEQLSKLGDSGFELDGVEIENLEEVIVPKSVLNKLRRDAVSQLQELEHRKRSYIKAAVDVEDDSVESAVDSAPDKSSLTVLIRDIRQLDDMLKSANSSTVDCIYLDLVIQKELFEAIDKLGAAGVPLGLVSPRIVKPGEESSLEGILSHKPDRILARNLASLGYLKANAPEIHVTADHSLNAANPFAARQIRDLGVELVTPASDAEKLCFEEFLDSCKSPQFCEILLYHWIPMFQLEHCQYTNMLDGGKLPGKCAKLCNQHELTMIDRKGFSHILRAEPVCRTTVYHARPIYNDDMLTKMLTAGFRNFRVEFMDEKPKQAAKILADLQVKLG